MKKIKTNTKSDHHFFFQIPSHTFSRNQIENGCDDWKNAVFAENYHKFVRDSMENKHIDIRDRDSRISFFFSSFVSSFFLCCCCLLLLLAADSSQSCGICGNNNSGSGSSCHRMLATLHIVQHKCHIIRSLLLLVSLSVGAYIYVSAI